MPLPIVIVGAGDHARVVLATLRLASTPILGWVGEVTRSRPDDPKLLSSGELEAADRQTVELANGIGSIEQVERRRDAFERYKAAGFRFRTVIHPGAYVSPDALLGEGAQAMAAAVVQTGVRTGVNVLINSGAIVEHDCQVERHCHIASGAVLSGGVEIGEASHIGAGAVLRQYVRIGADAVVGAGAVVVTNVPDRAIVAGVPARPLQRYSS